MDYRKLISFGKGGYVISIPKSWVQEHRLAKGSVVMLERSGEQLAVSPSQNGAGQQRQGRGGAIRVDGSPQDVVLHMLTAAYLNSYDTITISGEQLSSVLPRIRQQIQKLIALEVMESSRTRLVLKDFLDFSAISIADHLRKMDILIRSMFTDLIEHPGQAEEMGAHDDDVDRLFFVVAKAMRKAANDPAVLKSLRLSLQELCTLSHHAGALESLADEIERFARETAGTQLSAAAAKDVRASLAEMQQLYLTTMRALHKQDAQLALALAAGKRGLIDACTAKQQRYASEHPAPVLLEMVKRMARINHSIVRRMTE